MTIAEFIELMGDPCDVVFRIFDCNLESCVLIPAEDSDGKLEVTAEELLADEYSNLEICGFDMWIYNRQIYIEFNVDIEEDV